MSLHDMMARDMDSIHSTAEMGETIHYKDSDGCIHEFVAIVYRWPLKPSKQDKGRTLTTPIEIEIRESVIPIPAVGDMVQLKPRIGKDEAWQPVTEVVPASGTEAVHLVGVGR